MGMFGTTGASISGVLEDLKQVNDNKSHLMQKYSDRQQEILGGRQVSDLPLNFDEEYYVIGEKKRILNGLENR